LASLASMLYGAALVLPGESFNADKVLDSIHTYGGTLLYGVPTMMLEVVNAHSLNSSARNVSTLRGGAMAGSLCPSELVRRMIDELNLREMVCAYGMTETSPISFSTDIGDSIEIRCSTVGRVVDHVESKIIDSATRKVLKWGEVGEIATKGYSVMLGYWNQPEKTKESITEDGFMLTGDLGTIDAQGFCRIVGRSKDMIIRGGENIFPAEIENYLLKMKGVMDVSCIGVPDEKYGEEVCVWIRPKESDITLDEIVAFCKGKIAHYKIPRYVFNVQEFPLTVSGKIKKNEMREITSDWLKKKARL